MSITPTTQTGTLPIGVHHGGKVHRDFEVRATLLGDEMDAMTEMGGNTGLVGTDRHLQARSEHDLREADSAVAAIELAAVRHPLERRALDP